MKIAITVMLVAGVLMLTLMHEIGRFHEAQRIEQCLTMCEADDDGDPGRCPDLCVRR